MVRGAVPHPKPVPQLSPRRFPQNPHGSAFLLSKPLAFLPLKEYLFPLYG